ncbi:MAG: YbhB/YbcL family Raf kinase inhibitor-like protein [Acidobacteriaceae bacterium]
MNQRNQCMVTARAIFRLSCALVLAAAAHGCRRASVHDPAPNSLTVSSDDFQQGKLIPQQFSCRGANVSPTLSWGNLPPGTKSLALVVSDSDSFLGAYVHWVLYNLPPEPNHLAQGVPGVETLPSGARQGGNSGDTVGYSGPCPPGRSPHRYVFTLYALDAKLAPSSPMKKDQLMKAMEGHVLASGQLTGRFPR